MAAAVAPVAGGVPGDPVTAGDSENLVLLFPPVRVVLLRRGRVCRRY